MSNASKDLENLATLKGGKKRMWLELHKDLILQFYEEFGEDTTRQVFYLKKITLDRHPDVRAMVIGVIM